MTSGKRKFIVKLDDEDYEKILELPVPLIYTQHDHRRGYHRPYVLPEGYGKKKKFVSNFIYVMKSGQGLVHYDEDRYNFQSDNIGMRNTARNWRKRCITRMVKIMIKHLYSYQFYDYK